MDRFLMDNLNNKYALTSRECVKKSGTRLSTTCSTPLKCFALGKKLVHDLA